jgi:uncharacterized protein YkwD
MARAFFILILLSPAGALFAGSHHQSDPWKHWNEETVRKLHTASEIPYKNEEEKKVILFMNMARYDGTLFAETFLDAYVNHNQMDNSSELRSLYRDLKRIRGLPPLQPRKDLTSVAQEHATRMGESGRTGHQRFKQRFEPLMGNPYQHVGENCSYGYFSAIDIVISLLIDEGVKDLGHRKNILNEGFNSVGVAIRPHKTYRVNCVMDFGAMNPTGDLNEIPY